MTDPARPWSASTADTWADGVLAGTGVAGALLYGAPDRHVIAFAHEEFFVPANSRRPAPHLAPALPEVRAALADGDETRAADAVDRTLREQDWDPESLIWTDPLGPIAQLEWEPEAAGWSDYRREITLDDGGVGSSWSRFDADRAGLRIQAVRGEAGFDVIVWADRPTPGVLSLRPVAETGSDAATVLPVDYSGRVHTEVDTSSDELAIIVRAHGPTPEADAEAGVRVRGERSYPPHPHGGWQVTATADGVRFRVDVAAGTQQTLGSTEPATRDLGDASTLLGRSVLTLDGARRRDEPTEHIWAAARAGDAEAERRVFELAYAAGRRNIVLSTGELPPTLQGVWQGTWSPAWSADYTLNGNVQLGALAAVLWTGTPELMSSLFRLVTRFTDHYRSNARSVFGLEGMMLPARLTTHGHANHFLRDYPHQFWVGNGPWMLRLAADYVQVTGDRTPIDEWLWEYAVEILGFSLDLVRAGGGHLNPSYSPENTPAGRDNPLVTDATSDIAAIRDGLSVGIWLADLRGDHERAREWARARDQLPPYPVTADGALAEWAPVWPENVAHRHASQLQGLWYEPDERLAGPLRDAAARTVRDKLAWRAEDPSGPPGNMEMAFGLTSMALAAVAVGDADAAYRCALWLARDHVTPALTTTHDAGAIFNLDASGALPAIVAALLLRSTPGGLDILPALPAAWPSGSITGLTGRGGVRVAELSWNPGGVRVCIDLVPEGRWLRPDGVQVTLPAEGRVVAGRHVTTIDARTVLVRGDAESAELTFAYTAPGD
jgi:alpha-L-fucosidase 2